MVFGQLVMPVQCCAEAPAASAVPPGIKSSAFLRVEHPFAWKFEVQIFLTCLQLVGTLGKHFFQEYVPPSNNPHLAPLGLGSESSSVGGVFELG